MVRRRSIATDVEDKNLAPEKPHRFVAKDGLLIDRDIAEAKPAPVLRVAFKELPLKTEPEKVEAKVATTKKTKETKSKVRATVKKSVPKKSKKSSD